MIASLSISGYGLPSGGTLVVDVAFAIVFGVMGYHLSRRHRMLRGVTPWRLPSIAWAFICLVLQPIGIIVELVAEFTTRPVEVHEAVLAPVQATLVAPISPPSAFSPPPTDEEGHAPLFGWYPDVTKRHELRYWDGKHWSEHISDAGVLGIDPIEA